MEATLEKCRALCTCDRETSLVWGDQGTSQSEVLLQVLSKQKEPAWQTLWTREEQVKVRKIIFYNMRRGEKGGEAGPDLTVMEEPCLYWCKPPVSVTLSRPIARIINVVGINITEQNKFSSVDKCKLQFMIFICKLQIYISNVFIQYVTRQGKMQIFSFLIQYNWARYVHNILKL